MLLLVTIVLVLVAAVTLLIGIFSDSLPLIFLSIGASGAAAVVLAILSQLSRRRGREAEGAPGAPAPLADTGAAAATGGAAPSVGPPTVATASEPATSVMGVVGAMPIEGYDSLRVNEILPRLEGLGIDQLEAVAEHEESNKNRTTILNRIDQLLDQLEGVDAGAAAPVEEEAPIAAAVAASDADAGFPIPNYEMLSEAQVIAALADLDADQLETVADREEAGPNRDAVLDAIDDRLDILEGIVPAPAAASAKKTAAKKAPAKKAAASKAPAKSAVAAKKTASKAPAKKTPGKKSAAAPAPAKKAPAKSAVAAKKTATPAKKAATTTKKAAPVKKAAAAKKAAKR